MSYDGSGFRGFAENSGVRTIAGDLREKLQRVYRQPIKLTCAGRTDAGVHARDQVVTFDVIDALVEPERLRKSLNSLLAPAVVVSEVAIVGADFDARYSATWRHYRYLILNGPLPDPFRASTWWWVNEKLDLDAMKRAASPLVGLHDFSSFCRRPRSTPEASLVRRLLIAEWGEVEDPHGVPHPGFPNNPPQRLLSFDIAASAFCHQMVRSIVGFLVDVGRGHFREQQVYELLEGRDRGLMGNIAPPHGLCLWKIGYPGDAAPDEP